MKTYEKKIDRIFLDHLYPEKVHEIDYVFKSFLDEIPQAVAALARSLNKPCCSTAREIIRHISQDCNAIGLPALGVHIQIVGVYIDFHKLGQARNQLKNFERELAGYMPVIINEYSRLKAYRHLVKTQPVKMLAG